MRTLLSLWVPLLLCLCTIYSVNAQTVQPYILFRPEICSGVTSASGPFQVKVVNNGGNPANWSNPSFTTHWYLQINGAAIQSGDFQGQVSTLNFSGISYTSTDDIRFYAIGTGINTAPLNFDYVLINILYPPSKPSINPSATTICGAGTVVLNAIGGGNTYTWSTGATGTTITVGAGTYTVHESNSCGNSPESDPVTIYAYSIPAAPTISSSAGNLLCNGATTILSTSPSYGGTIYWSTGVSGNSITVSSAGTYYAYEVNSCGTSGNSNTVSISTGIVPGTPSISSSNGNLLCNGSSTTLSATPSAGGTIHWNIGAAGNSITVSSAGNYYAYETNGCGNSANSNTLSISTQSTPPAPSLSINGSVTLCNGLGQTITTGPSSSGGVIHWSNGATGNSITVYTSGNYYAWESNGCGNGPNSATVVISTLNTPAAPSVTPAGSLVLCDGASTTLSSSGTVNANILWYYNGSSTGHFGATYLVSAAGSYSTAELSSCGTSPLSNTVTITTNHTPPAPALTVSGTVLLCDGAGQAIATAPSTSGGTIHWSTGATGNSITVTSPGSYYAWESNSSCGAGPNGAVVTITTLNKPPAPSVNPPGSQLLCNGASATLTSSGSNITWSNGVTGNTLVTTMAGNYFAIDHNACGNSANSNAVVITTGNCPIPAPGTSFLICPGTLKTLDAGAGYDSYLWNTGATTRSISVGPGSYTVTVLKNGCYAVSATVTVSNYSVGAALISSSGPTNFCAGSSVTLSSSAGSSYLWSNGATGNSIVVNNSGSYSVTVTDANGCQSTSATTTVSVNPLPSATIAGSTSVCQNGAAPSLLFSGSGGTAPYTFTYSINGGSNQTLTTASGNNVSVNVPVSSAGTYTYALLGVQESGATACANTASGSATVVVVPLPSATIAGSTSVCLNSPAPSVTFTGSGATAPYTFTYRINAGSNQTVTTISGNSVSLAVPTNATGTFTYTLISVQESSGTACSNTASGAATVVVNPLPLAMISGNAAVCQNSAPPQVVFTGSGGTTPYTFFYKINGGTVQTIHTTTGNSVGVTVPTGTPGTFIYTLVSVQESGGTSCSNPASGTATVVVSPLPAATITGSTTVCQNSSLPSITFTGSGATAPYLFTYKINGGPNQTVTTSSGNSVSIQVPTITAGTYTYTLIGVRESSGVSCNNPASGTATVVVNPLPSATLSGDASVCQNSTAPLVTFTGSGGTAPYTFTYQINGGSNQTATTTSGSSATVAVPTNTSGFFTYHLVSVQESGSTSCISAASGSATVAVSQLPTAAIAGSATVCQNSSSPQITFTGSAGIAPFIFTYRVNGGANQTVTTTSGNSVSISVPTGSAGTFTYSLVSVQQSGTGACINTATGSATVVVNPLPSATITGSTSVCQNSASPSISFTGSGATPPYTFAFKLNGGSGQTVTTTSGNNVSVSVPTNTAGTYTYSLIGVQESGGTACMNAASGSAMVVVNPLPSATIAGSVSVCQNSTSPLITFTGNGGTPPYTFTYEINGGTSQTITTTSGSSVSVSVPTSSSGTFLYTLISVVESGGTSCTNTASGSATVTVNPQPAKAALVTPDTHLCNGSAGQITIVNYTSGFTYSWYKDGLLLKSSGLDTIMNNQPGRFTVMATSDKGCDAASVSDSVIITTGSVATPVITGYTKICIGGKTRLMVIPKDSTMVYEVWRWTDPPGHLLSRDSIFSAPAGQYQIWVGREGCFDSALVHVTADDTDFPAGHLTINPVHIPYGGQTILLAEVRGATTYQWDMGDGNTAITHADKIFQNYYTAGDSLKIKLSAVSERNCITQFSAILKVDPPKADTIPDLSRTGNLKDWNLFPTPFHNLLQLSVVLNRNETVRVDLFTAEGTWIRSWQFPGKKGENLFVFDKLESLAPNVVYLVNGIYNGEKHFDKIYKY